jgi:hypothetical protein
MQIKAAIRACRELYQKCNFTELAAIALSARIRGETD